MNNNLNKLLIKKEKVELFNYMNKDNFYERSFLLTLSNLTTGVLGFIFITTLSKELGPEGMGVYGLIMPIMGLVLCLICGGIIVAISKLSAEYVGKKDYFNLYKTISTTIKFNFLWSTLVVLAFYFLSTYIAIYVIKDIRTINALKILSPAMVFMALSNTFKGYFYGVSKIFIPAIIDIFEKAIRIIMLLTLINIFGKDSVEKTVTLAYIALLIGEFVSLILLFLYYKLDKNKLEFSNIKPLTTKQIMYSVLIISLPLCLNGFFDTILSTVATLIIPRRLVSSGMDYNTAMATIGKFTGMALNIVFFPFVIIGSINTLLIPDISKNISMKEDYKVSLRVSEVLRISYLLGLSILIIGNIVPNELGKAVFNRDDLGNYISFMSVAAPIFSVSMVTYSILNGIGKQKILLRNSILTSIIEIIFLYILVGNKYLNIYGFGITITIVSAVSIFLNLYEINKGFKIELSLFTILFDVLTYILVLYFIKIFLSFIPNIHEIYKIIMVILFSFLYSFVLFNAKKSLKLFSESL